MSFQCSVCANKNTADCVLCQNCESFEPKKQTNADRIRGMTDEELAEWVWSAESAGRAYGPRGKNAWIDWLKQEAKT